MDKVAYLLVALLCCFIHPSVHARSPFLDQLWVNGDGGVDNSTCGPTEAPCKTICYIVGEIYKKENLSFVEISLQSNILNEDCNYAEAVLSPVIIHISGYHNTIKGCTLTIPKVEYIHSWFDSSTIAGHTISFTFCTITQSIITGLEEQEEQLPPTLTLDASHIIDSNATFHTLNISDTLFSNSPMATPIDGRCDVTNSNFTNTIGATALYCGSSTISTCVFSGNQGINGGAINSQYTFIWDSVIVNNSAVYGGGIYSQGFTLLDNVQIIENQATQAGGGLYFYGPQADMECMDSVSILNNNAQIGGGMVIMSEDFSSNMQGSGQMCVFMGNTATNQGGAIYVNASAVSLLDFLISENSAPIGAGIFSASSMLNLSSVTITGNVGGGVHSVDSAVVFILSRFINNSDFYGANLDIRLRNSSSYITSWDQVWVSGEKTFLCDDCNGKLCSAGTSCSDCSNGCITMGTRAICIESHFGCEHGACEVIKDKSPSCKCTENYTGDLCDEHMPLSSQWENLIFIIIFGVGCTITLIVVVAFIVRLHRQRAQYQPLLSYAKLLRDSQTVYK